MKKGLIAVCFVGIIAILLSGAFFLFVVSGAFLVLGVFAPNPPAPVVKCGEFPFVLTYEIDGEIKTIEDTLICEYDGVKWTNSGDKKRKWKSWIKGSGGEDIILLDLSDKNEYHELGYKMLDLYFSCGSAEYYMGDDEGYRRAYAVDLEMIHFHYIGEEGKIGGSAYKKDEAYEKYKLRIIDWKIEEPVDNEFKDTIWTTIYKFVTGFY